MDTVILQVDTPTAAPQGVSIGDDTSDVRALWSSADNLAKAFSEVAATRAEYSALETNDAVFSYKRMWRAAQFVQQYLRARSDYSAGMRVALKLSNSPEYVAAFYGVLLADCVVVPLPAGIEKSRRRSIEELCQPRLTITRREDTGDQKGGPSVTVLRITDEVNDMTSLSAPRRQGDDLAMILFTSGSTGMPKGVMLSHRNLLVNADSILRALPIRSDDKALMLVPFCHSFGNSILQTHILAGAALIVGAKLVFPESITQALARFKATSFSAIPETFGTLLKYGRLEERPLPHLRYMSAAGGGIRPDIAAEIAARIAPATFHVMYGQSEATARLACLPPDQLAVRRGSIGKPIFGVELAVRDDSGRDLKPGEVGMLYARGGNVMPGYWNDREMTEKILSSDGWLQTGDMAHCDEAGYFYLDGRANLLVKVQGHRVHPAEIESVVEANFPNVRAIALPMVRGEETRFALFVAAQDGQRIDVADIRAACMRELPSYKVPHYFEIVEDLPLTSAYKVDRAALSLRIPQS